MTRTARWTAASLMAFLSATDAIGAQVATRATVSGVVVRVDGGPIVGAVVSILGRDDSTLTSASGEFRFVGVRPGQHSVRVRAIGYEPRLERVQVSADSGWHGTIALSRLQVLPDIAVVATGSETEWKYDDFFRRQKLGQGVFRTREDFEKLGASDIVSALRSISGVNVSTTANPKGEEEVRWRIARCPGQPPNIAIYVNGQQSYLTGASANKGSELSGAFRGGTGRNTCQGCARMGDLLSSLPLMDVMFIEFYRGPGQIPSDLNRGDACAVLMIWTR